MSALGSWLVHNLTERPDTELGRHEAAETCRRLLALHARLGDYVCS